MTPVPEHGAIRNPSKVSEGFQLVPIEECPGEDSNLPLDTKGNPQFLGIADAESDVVDASDTQLRWLIEQWPTLSASSRKCIIELAGQLIESREADH